MTPERWAQIEELFHHARECGQDERVSILEEAGSTDPELRREVERLLSSEDGASAHLRNVVGGNTASLQESRAEASVFDGGAGSAKANDLQRGGRTLLTEYIARAESAETVIGPYRLLELIGEGGMGEVWLAEQSQPVRRRVALKLIKAGMNTREVVARFEGERQALALMDHPCIAKVFDAGSTPRGRPYFVMEYVPGTPITNYCDAHKLTIRERLELFVQVCEGVQHAHQKAIIHRDLKPSNIWWWIPTASRCPESSISG